MNYHLSDLSDPSDIISPTLQEIAGNMLALTEDAFSIHEHPSGRHLADAILYRAHTGGMVLTIGDTMDNLSTYEIDNGSDDSITAALDTWYANREPEEPEYVPIIYIPGYGWESL